MSLLCLLGTAAGRPIFFSLCGWEEWYAPPDPTVGYGGGKTLGNSYRIHGDGSSWSHLSGCTNTIAAIGEYSGPGHWVQNANFFWFFCCCCKLPATPAFPVDINLWTSESLAVVPALPYYSMCPRTTHV